MNKELLGMEVFIDGKEGEIINICGYWYKIGFFNINYGECLIHKDDISEYLL